MGSVGRYRKCLLAGIALGAFGARGARARRGHETAAQGRQRSRPSITGPGSISAAISVTAPAVLARHQPEPLQGAFFPHSVTGMIGGYQAGYNWQLANRVVLGVEADISFGSPVDIPRLAPASFNTTIDYIATGRGRLGYAMGTWMPYVTGGVAWGSTHVGLNDLGSSCRRSDTSRMSAGPRD